MDSITQTFRAKLFAGVATLLTVIAAVVEVVIEAPSISFGAKNTDALDALIAPP